MSGYRRALIEEIDFWQELIDESASDGSSPEYQRMHYALKLAERKLQNYELKQVTAYEGVLNH